MIKNLTRVKKYKRKRAVIRKEDNNRLAMVKIQTGYAILAYFFRLVHTKEANNTHDHPNIKWKSPLL